ncbi:hypothetical protein [Streptomyces sp. NPDC057686]|uniref:hypothetical protein n=1 Tax=Streptomyces TaxID=1883 RepID=UPI0036B41217
MSERALPVWGENEPGVYAEPREWFWLATVQYAGRRGEARFATRRGVVGVLPSLTRWDAYDAIDAALREELGTEFVTLAFVLEPNSMGGAR